MGNREFEEVVLLFAKEHTTGSGSVRLIRKIGGYFYDARQPEIDALKAEVERLRKDAERYQHILDCNVIAERKYLPNLDAEEYTAKLRANHDVEMKKTKPTREFESDIDGDEYK